MNKKSKKLGVGCTAFNNEGQILAKVAKIKDGESLKVLAIEEEFDIALCYKWRKVCFNRDLKIVFDAIKNLHSDHP